MELGISPIITSGMVFQVRFISPCSGDRLVDVL